MEQWVTLDNEVRQAIFICLVTMPLGAWIAMYAMNKLDIRERKRKEALRYEKENFTVG